MGFGTICDFRNPLRVLEHIPLGQGETTLQEKQILADSSYCNAQGIKEFQEEYIQYNVLFIQFKSKQTSIYEKGEKHNRGMIKTKLSIEITLAQWGRGSMNKEVIQG